MRKIEAIEIWIDHLKRIWVYRKSYKLYGIIKKTLQITRCILDSTAVLAIVPVIPVFLAVISVVPIVIGIITNATKLNDKKTTLKCHHRKFKALLSYVNNEIMIMKCCSVSPNRLDKELLLLLMFFQC